MATKKKPGPAKLQLTDGKSAKGSALPDSLPGYEGDYDGATFKVFEGNLVVKGDLNLDSEGSIAVLGDLEVKGTIGNYDGDSGPALIVTGNLKAKNVVAGGSEMKVQGDVTLGNGLYAFYNHGQVSIGGDLSAKGVLCSDHSVGVDGKVVAPVLAIGGTMTNDFPGQEIGEILSKGLVTSDGSLDHAAVLKRVGANKTLFVGNATPSRFVVLKEIEKLGESGDVLELDLSDKGLRELPVELTSLSSLKSLNLHKNWIESLPASIADLTELKSLTLPNTLKEICPELGSLGKLEHLNLGYIEAPLPETIGNLSSLRSLVLGQGEAPLPDSLAKLSALEELKFSKRNWFGFKSIPTWIFELSSLIDLNLSSQPVEDIPEQLGKLTKLEHLNLSSSLAYVKRAPDFSTLTKLRTLKFPGSTHLTQDPPPSHTLVDAAFTAHSVEDLGLDRWGKKEARPDFILPDRFDELPNLRRIDLAFNGLLTLPESFFRLEHLAVVDLRYSDDLSQETIERLLETYPSVAFDFGSATALWEMPGVMELGKLHSEAFAAADGGQHAKATKLFTQVCEGYETGICPSEINRMLAFTGLLVGLSRDAFESKDPPAKAFRKAREWGERALPRLGNIWRFTKLGEAQMDVKRLASYAVARHMLAEGKELDKALATVLDALPYIDGPDHWHLIDLAADIYMALDKPDKAFEMAHRLLRENPKRKQLAHIAKHAGYKAWQQR